MLKKQINPSRSRYHSRYFKTIENAFNAIISMFANIVHQGTKPHKFARYFSCDCLSENVFDKKSPIKCWYVPPKGNMRTNEVLLIFTISESLCKRYGLHSTQFALPIQHIIRFIPNLKKALNKGFIGFGGVYDKVTFGNFGLDKYGRKTVSGELISTIWPKLTTPRKIGNKINPAWNNLRERRDSFLHDLYVDFLFRDQPVAIMDIIY